MLVAQATFEGTSTATQNLARALARGEPRIIVRDLCGGRHMRLCESLEAVAAISPTAFEDLRRDVDPEWILQALEATGWATLRTRRLPAAQVVWLVIGMALVRNRSIHDIVSKLDLALPGSSLTVAPSTVVETRARLGAAPMEWLFEISAEHWVHQRARTHRPDLDLPRRRASWPRGTIPDQSGADQRVHVPADRAA